MINFLKKIIKNILNFICIQDTLLEGNKSLIVDISKKKNTNITYYENGVFVGRKCKIGGMSFQSLYKLNENLFFSKLVLNRDKKNLINLKNEYRLLSLVNNEQYFCKVYSYVKNINYSFIIMERYYIDLFQYIMNTLRQKK